jgi:hypothetical protein
MGGGFVSVIGAHGASFVVKGAPYLTENKKGTRFGAAVETGVENGPLNAISPGMPTDFRVFRERLAHACRVRNLAHDRLCCSIGLGGRRVIDLEFSGLKALDIERLSQIADRLNVSVDWLLGRSGPPAGCS